MKVIWTFIRWFFGLTFCLASIGGFASGEFWQALFTLGLGLLLLPPVTKALSKKTTDANSDTQIQPQILKTKTTQHSNSSQSSDKLVNITSKSVGNNTTEMTIELNEEVLLKKLKDGTLGSGKREIDIEDITGFYGTKKYSLNRQYCVSYADGYYDNNKWKNGDIALVKDNKLLFKKKLQRPNDCFVNNDGTVIVCDWLNSGALTGKFFVFSTTGEELFSKKTTANLGNCAISDNSQIALFETHNSDTNDGDKIFIVDIPNKQIIRKFERPASFNNAIIDTENKRIRLKDHRGFVFEIDFEGNQTNAEEYENHILTKGSVYDRLWVYAEKPDETKLKDPKYLELLNKALTDKDASYSFGKDKIYRMIGEYYEANADIPKTIENWEKAIQINPKIGVKRKLDSLKKQERRPQVVETKVAEINIPAPKAEKEITEQYIIAYREFVNVELALTAQHNGEEYAKRMAPYYEGMYKHISQNPSEYIVFNDDCDVTYYEMEFIEAVEPIRERLFELAKQNNIPTEILFIPRVKIKEGFWGSIINRKVIKIVRQLFDEEQGEEYATLRQFKAFDRSSPINKWTTSKNGKNFLYEFQVSQGIRAETLIRKRLYLFDKEFVRQQMMWMSEKIWLHNEVVTAYKKWEQDNSLWNKIDHIKRKIEQKEILDESRKEIKFLRMLENAGLKGRFIHDESISWQLKYRPDFWFINENLIVEYDEIAHKLRTDEDVQREKIIKKHIPNVHFIRVQEGLEKDGLQEVLDFLKSFSE
ncbi:hypothetical protein FW774_10695 [Pedobacter sp. BS3]|uniref:hypothetical protein n=1 Tax=Pedobacter sp. BS3 TaxID=2567937 RepID=UPI0011EC21A0|nr:hypothetical protein [Pedobacter sp. BS3]TZF83916.1 hypothetical protein FW774_10695 [Pedobacter sp. BS3]